MDILLVSDTPEKWSDCIAVLEQKGYRPVTVTNMTDALSSIRTTPPVLAILDSDMDAGGIRKAVIDILMVNAAVHTAVSSEMPDEVFHDAMEGLGILMGLPLHPSPADMITLLDALEKVS